MEKIRSVIQQMIHITETELDEFLDSCFLKTFARREIVSHPGVIPNEIFFINSGLFRIMIIDAEGNEHSIHFAPENQFIADYSSFMLKEASIQTIQAL